MSIDDEITARDQYGFCRQTGLYTVQYQQLVKSGKLHVEDGQISLESLIEFNKVWEKWRLVNSQTIASDMGITPTAAQSRLRKFLSMDHAGYVCNVGGNSTQSSIWMVDRSYWKIAQRYLKSTRTIARGETLNRSVQSISYPGGFQMYVQS